MAWRVAYSLDELRNEVNARWPNRNKASDGTIGDPAHAAIPSDHNPNAAGVVCAFDITNDNINGPGSDWLARQFLASPHPDAKYFIWNRQIASKTHGWTVRSFTGSDPHTSHMHVSVGVGPDGASQQPYDDRVAWLRPSPVPPPPPVEDDVTPATLVDNGTFWYFVTAPDKTVWAKAGVDPWFTIGGEAHSGPAAAIDATGRISVVVKGANGELWQCNRVAGAWDQTWTTLGGEIG